MTLYTSLAILLCVTCASLFYFGSPHQKLLAKPLPTRPMYGLSLVGLVASGAYLNMIFGPATAIFFLMTIVMLVLTVVPIAIAYIKNRASNEVGK